MQAQIRITACPVCGVSVENAAVPGRKRVYCSARCKRKARERRDRQAAAAYRRLLREARSAA